MCDCKYLTKSDLQLGDVIHFSRDNLEEHHNSNRWLVYYHDDVKGWMVLDINEHPYSFVIPVTRSDLQVRLYEPS